MPFPCMIAYNKAGLTPPKKGIFDMWFVALSFLIIALQRAFLPLSPYIGQFYTDAEEYDYR